MEHENSSRASSSCFLSSRCGRSTSTNSGYDPFGCLSQGNTSPPVSLMNKKPLSISAALGLLILVLTARVFGAAPDKIDGNVYYESVQIGGGLTRQATTFALMLKSDGTFTALFSVTTNFSGGPFVYRRDDGFYTYTKIDDQTADLVLSSFPQVFGGALKRTLKFSSDTSGTIPVVDPTDLFTSGHVFRFASLGSAPPLVNCSNRSFVRAGGTAFTGFVIANGASRAVLVRASGPSLIQFGVNDALRNPTLTIFNAATNAAVSANDDWSPEDRSNAPGGSSGFTGRADAIKRTGALVGAFSLVENSNDAAMILSLPPGSYIAQVSSPEAVDSGQALIEVYILP